MATSAETNCERLRERFEGRHAIYVEKGVTCVQVMNIRYSVAARDIAADVIEVSSPYSAGGMFQRYEQGDLVFPA